MQDDEAWPTMHQLPDGLILAMIFDGIVWPYEAHAMALRDPIFALLTTLHDFCLPALYRDSYSMPPTFSIWLSVHLYHNVYAETFHLFDYCIIHLLFLFSPGRSMRCLLTRELT